MAILKKTELDERTVSKAAALLKSDRPQARLTAAIHLGQLGPMALNQLLKIKKNGGFVLSFGVISLMLDMIDMPSYRMGLIQGKNNAAYMDMNVGDSFIQWVPCGQLALRQALVPANDSQAFANVYSHIRVAVL